MAPPLFSPPAPNVPYFTPAQFVPAGTAIVHSEEERKALPTLFQPIKIRGLEFHNRVWLSPLCQYSAEDGVLGPWHLAHLGGIISRGPGLALAEATAVLPEGRISPEDTGIWNDAQVAAWRTIVDFAHSQNQKIGLQLAHAGRKSSTLAPFIHMGAAAPPAANGWPDEIWGPSAVPYSEAFHQPKELTKEGIQRIVTGFVDGARRALKAGFDVLEVHGAHGYLISEFLSPQSNRRTDEYGGSFENRTRLALEVVDAVRAIMPPTMPLFFRISASELLEDVLPNEPSWRSEDTVRLAGLLAEHGVDLLDVSSGGNNPAQRFRTGPTPQAQFAAAVKAAHGDKILVGAVGGITDGKLAQGVLDKGEADIVFVGRLFQKNPGAVWTFAEDLGVEVSKAKQIGWGFSGRPGAPPKGLQKL